MREFAPDSLADDLDFSALQRVNSKFHVSRDSASRREGDVIWRLPTREGVDTYLYLLIEFQSGIDWWMAVRTQTYQGLLWQQVIQEKRLDRDALLPPLLLLVLYNGMPRWNAPIEISRLIGLESDSRLWNWQSQARYHLLDIRAVKQEKLSPRDNLVTLLFRLEQPYSPDEFGDVVRDVHEWFQRHEGFPELQRLFEQLIRQILRRSGIQGPIPEDLRGILNMMEVQGKRWREQWHGEGRAQGLAEGKVEGKTEGKVEGKAEDLECLLVSRFSVLPPFVLQRIRGARLAELETWFKRALYAQDLPSVFGSSP